MDHLAKELDAAIAKWNDLGWPHPEAMVVTGSGLASTDIGKQLHGPQSWAEFLPFPVWGIEGHPLNLEILEPIPGRTVLFSRGRLHGYQDYTPAQLVFGIRMAARLGCRMLILTNSAGGLHPRQSAGDLMVISDHINLSGKNPLTGIFPSAWGPQFPDMTEAYDPALRRLMLGIGEDLNIALDEGVYCCVAGPSYETPAEVRMLRHLGGDAVGMSTVPEVIAAHHMGLRCAALSLISNPGAGVTDEKLDHEDVITRGREASGRISQILARLLAHPDLLRDPEA